ncbi:YopX family protein [Enterococcus sp. AZ046]|uniref:YopX family protein n=1 Tax=Enterococcus sp. AZ046 TaxID=2774685 RepID=UPI003D29977C
MVPKFRGKRKDNGEWVVGVPIPNSFCNVVHMIAILLTDKVAYPPERLHEYLIEIVPETLGQSTGLKDKNGVEVFQGDIVRCTRGCPHEVVWLQEYAGMYVGGMPAWYLSGLSEGYAWTGEEEIIGNIYEKPELLEEEK